MHFRKKILTLFLGFCFYAVYGYALICSAPNTIFSVSGEDISKRPFSPRLTENTASVSENVAVGRQFTAEHTAEISLCGIIPIKTVTVKTLPSATVIPSGNPVGIKMYTKGAVVVSTDALFDGLRDVSPALFSGIKPGDVIVSVNGEEVVSTEELLSKVNSESLTLTVIREGKSLNFKISPVKTADGYKLGLWVRDSCAGIGTLTFYCPDNGRYAALGHGLTDSDAGIVLPLDRGELTYATIISVNKGKVGVPGELCGVFSSNNEVLGSLEANNPTGIVGKLFQTDFLNARFLRLCPRDEIKCGKAYILSCISGNEPQKFEIEIQKVYNGEKGPSKDMVISVTDPKLIQKTGGIVQGMSGSPIIQNDKLVGAVTHVCVNL